MSDKWTWQQRLDRQEDALDWDRIRTARRSALNDVRARGIGPRRLQLIVCPSFGESRAWEIRESEGEWRVYESEVVQSSPEIHLLGYRSLTVGSDVLTGYFRRVVELSLPLLPDLSNRAGVDGTTTQLAVFGDMDSGCRFQWWSEAPPQWQPLVVVVREMAETFLAAGGEGTEGR